MKMSSWINISKCTLLIFTPSFANETWVRIFNEGRKTYNARTNAGRRLIPVIMPGFRGTALLNLLGTRAVLANKPIEFGRYWKKDEAAWDKLTNTISALEHHHESRECINLVEFSTNMAYIMRSRIPPDIFTNNNVRRIMRELSDEQERRLQTKLDMNKSDIKKLYQQKDRRQRIREMVKMWLRRTYYPNETQLVKQLSEYFNQITDGTPINEELERVV